MVFEMFPQLRFRPRIGWHVHPRPLSVPRPLPSVNMFCLCLDLRLNLLGHDRCAVRDQPRPGWRVLREVLLRGGRHLLRKESDGSDGGQDSLIQTFTKYFFCTLLQGTRICRIIGLLFVFWLEEIKLFQNLSIFVVNRQTNLKKI